MRPSSVPVALLLLGSLLACGAGRGDCPEPTNRESRYPFSGIFANDSVAVRLCLYQQDVRTVEGRLGSARAVGQVSRDGILTLAVGTNAGPNLYMLSLSGDTLRVTRALSATGTQTRLPEARLIRTSGD